MPVRPPTRENTPHLAIYTHTFFSPKAAWPGTPKSRTRGFGHTQEKWALKSAHSARRQALPLSARAATAAEGEEDSWRGGGVSVSVRRAAAPLLQATNHHNRACGGALPDGGFSPGRSGATARIYTKHSRRRRDDPRGESRCAAGLVDPRAAWSSTTGTTTPRVEDGRKTHVYTSGGRHRRRCAPPPRSSTPFFSAAASPLCPSAAMAATGE